MQQKIQYVICNLSERCYLLSTMPSSQETELYRTGESRHWYELYIRGTAYTSRFKDMQLYINSDEGEARMIEENTQRLRCDLCPYYKEKYEQYVEQKKKEAWTNFMQQLDQLRNQNQVIINQEAS